MEEKEGYTQMSERGQLMCELVELMARYDVLRIRQDNIPTYRVPKTLITAIQIRYQQLHEDEKAAVVDLRSKLLHRVRWSQWLERHLAEHPKDTVMLVQLEVTFAGGPYCRSAQVYQDCGLCDYPWQMEHND